MSSEHAEGQTFAENIVVVERLMASGPNVLEGDVFSP
jgi:hypothetical protein